LECLSQSFAGALEIAMNRSTRQPERFGNRRFGHVLPVGKEQHRSLTKPEASDCCSEIDVSDRIPGEAF
jgi:hypothetical protein